MCHASPQSSRSPLSSPSSGAAARCPASTPRQPRAAAAGLSDLRPCLACHNGLITPSGEDVSIGLRLAFHDDGELRARPVLAWPACAAKSWITRAAGRDRGRVLDLPHADGALPGAAAGAKGRVVHVPPGVAAAAAAPDAALAADGVSCTVCHQIAATGLGEPELRRRLHDRPTPAPAAAGLRAVRGRRGPRRVMRSAAGFSPRRRAHPAVRALRDVPHAVHDALGARRGDGAAAGTGAVPGMGTQRLPGYAQSASPATCRSWARGADHGHAWSAAPRLLAHLFRGGNFFVLGLLNRYRDELGVKALPQELDAAIAHGRSPAADTARPRLANAAAPAAGSSWTSPSRT